MWPSHTPNCQKVGDGTSLYWLSHVTICNRFVNILTSDQSSVRAGPLVPVSKTGTVRPGGPRGRQSSKAELGWIPTNQGQLSSSSYSRRISAIEVAKCKRTFCCVFVPGKMTRKYAMCNEGILPESLFVLWVLIARGEPLQSGTYPRRSEVTCMPWWVLKQVIRREARDAVFAWLKSWIRRMDDSSLALLILIVSLIICASEYFLRIKVTAPDGLNRWEHHWKSRDTTQ